MRFRKNKVRLLSVGIGAGVLGGLAVALRYATRPARSTAMPDALSPEFSRTRVVDTRHGQIVYREFGSGAPLVLVHTVCVGGSSYEWSKVAPQLARKYRVLVPDLLGFGESERRPVLMSAAEHADAIADFVHNTCGRERPVLVGNGLGAGFCALAAVRHPERVARLCLLMPTGLTEFGTTRLAAGSRLLGSLPWVNSFAYRNYLSRGSTVKTWLQKVAFADSKLVRDECVEVFTACAQQYGAEFAIFSLLKGRMNFDLADQLDQLDVPVRLLWAEQSVFPPVEWAGRFKRFDAVKSVTILHGSGFLAALEVPDAVVQVLLDELESDLRLVAAG